MPVSVHSMPFNFALYFFQDCRTRKFLEYPLHIRSGSMSTENGKYVADDNGRLDKRKAVKGFAEFCCSPVQNKDTWQESAEDYKVRNTKLEYTYPVRNSNTN